MKVKKSEKNGVFKSKKFHKLPGWKDVHYVSVYEYARAGMSNAQIVKALKIHGPTFKRWLEAKPALKEALDRGRELSQKNGTFREYIFRRLPTDLQVLWEQINAAEEEEEGILQIEMLLQREGKQARQHLFLYALTENKFNPSEACKKVNVSVSDYKRWLNDDPDFATLVEEVMWHKKNFFESKYFELVEEGDSAATIHAAKTLLRDRGYGDKIDINHTGQIDHRHLDLEKLNLPPEMMRFILERMREVAAQEQGGTLGSTLAIDVDHTDVD